MFCVACQLPVVREGAPNQKAADPQAPIPGLVALPEQPFETDQPGPSPTTSQTLPDDAGEREVSIPPPTYQALHNNLFKVLEILLNMWCQYWAAPG